MDGDDEIRLTYFITALGIGGAEVGLVRLVSGLYEADEPVEVTVVALHYVDDDLRSQLPESVSVVDLEIEGFASLHRLRTLWWLLDDTDVLLCSLYHAAILGRLLAFPRGVPVVTWYHAVEFKSQLRRYSYVLTDSLVDLTLVPSAAIADTVNSELGTPESSIRHVPLAGVNTDEFTPPADGRTPTDGIVVGSVGRFAPAKNMGAIVDIASRLADEPIRFEIVGDGPEFADVERRVDRESLDVALHGTLPPTAVPEFLQGIDIYVQPSRHEGLGISVLEAMACEVPVVASAVGGLHEAVDDGRTGYIVDPDDIDGFASRIAELADDPDRRERFGAAGRERVETTYSKTAMVDAFVDALAELDAWTPAHDSRIP